MPIRAIVRTVSIRVWVARRWAPMPRIHSSALLIVATHEFCHARHGLTRFAVISVDGFLSQLTSCHQGLAKRIFPAEW